MREDSDQERLAAYVDIWWQAVDDFTRLLEEIAPEDWSAATDLPGWDVHDVAAHIAHLEAILAGAPEETIEFDPPAHVRGMMGIYTEQGVLARRDHTADELIIEIRESATARRTALLADPPTDASAKPDRIFAGIPWDWERLLRNRILDVWMHEQDVRRAVGRPGNLDSPAAAPTTEYLLESLGYVVAKRVGAPAGTTVVVDVAGSPTAAVAVSDEGRGVPLEDPPDAPTVRLSTDRETFLLLAGGRGAPDRSDVTVEGDEELARQILDGFAVTP